MIYPKIPANERERLEALKNYSLLDTAPEKEYDEITFLAALICQCPISLVSLIDEQRVWFKSHYGLNEQFAPREMSFCAHAITNQNQMMIVEDARTDERFFDNPFVTGETNIVFYAGIPLVTSEGFALGVLCILDHKPRELTKSQSEALQFLGNQLLRLFEARKLTFQLKQQMSSLEKQNKGLNEFARIAAHDMKSPLNNITQLTDLLQMAYKDGSNTDPDISVQMIKQASVKLTRMIDGILEYSKNIKLLSENKKEFNLNTSIRDVLTLLQIDNQTQINIDISETLIIFTHKTAFEQIMLNLISNAIRYSDKLQKIINISGHITRDQIKIHVIDNGRGIRAEDKEKIFGLFETYEVSDTNGISGTGIGLATVLWLIDELGGSINVHSIFGEGSDFEVCLPLQGKKS